MQLELYAKESCKINIMDYFITMGKIFPVDPHKADAPAWACSDDVDLYLL